MVCIKCGKPMLMGEFKMEQRSLGKGMYYSYPVATWHMDGIKYCETPQTSTLGFYCSDCGTMVGVFRYTKPVNFIGRFSANLDDGIDILPTKKCPVCSQEIDIDYPRCPKCGYIYESI